ncbi:TonB family protein [Duganella dendranthematis]|jgi:TonB family protein|uniref:TonB family protein n=1 Tax=Duganella dendranthematis TaxID=2728021 RepID=A0ABX6M8Q7_9BURK|nr:TonB family protein [Duganella dendranthematis]QJD90421.1 TonB family protein [Duganella dendranthematis]
MRPLVLLLSLLAISTASAADLKTVALVDFSTCSKPEWPKEALRTEVTGTVRLKFLIDEDGNILDTLLLSSSGSTLLDDAAMAGIQRCKFKPSTVNGLAVRGWTKLEYRWTLDTDEITRQTVADAQKYRAAALAGDAGALYKLARIFRDGAGVPFNNDSYLKLLRASAQVGYAEAEFEMAANYYYGQILAKDLEQAIAWYELAAKHGNALAQVRLGDFYESGNAVIGQDLSQAAFWYSKAAEQGDHDAELALGRLYDNGKGVAHDAARSAVWYRKSAESGNAEACYRMGMVYLHGNDPVQAALWLVKASEQRQEMAEGTLANLYFTGAGVPQSDTEGFKYLRRAAMAGNTRSMRQLGLMLSQGVRVTADRKEGEFWLGKAARLGVPASTGDAVSFEF